MNAGRVAGAGLPAAVMAVVEAGFEVYGWRPWGDAIRGEAVAAGARQKNRRAVSPIGQREPELETGHQAQIAEILHEVENVTADEYSDAAELFFIDQRPTATNATAWFSKAAPGGPIELVVFFGEWGAAWGAATTDGDVSLRKALAAHGGRRAP